MSDQHASCAASQYNCSDCWEHGKQTELQEPCASDGLIISGAWATGPMGFRVVGWIQRDARLWRELRQRQSPWRCMWQAAGSSAVECGELRASKCGSGDSNDSPPVDGSGKQSAVLLQCSFFGGAKATTDEPGELHISSGDCSYRLGTFATRRWPTPAHGLTVCNRVFGKTWLSYAQEWHTFHEVVLGATQVFYYDLGLELYDDSTAALAPLGLRQLHSRHPLHVRHLRRDLPCAGEAGSWNASGKHCQMLAIHHCLHDALNSRWAISLDYDEYAWVRSRHGAGAGRLAAADMLDRLHERAVARLPMVPMSGNLRSALKGLRRAVLHVVSLPCSKCACAGSGGAAAASRLRPGRRNQSFATLTRMMFCASKPPLGGAFVGSRVRSKQFLRPSAFVPQLGAPDCQPRPPSGGSGSGDGGGGFTAKHKKVLLTACASAPVADGCAGVHIGVISADAVKLRMATTAVLDHNEGMLLHFHGAGPQEHVAQPAALAVANASCAAPGGNAAADLPHSPRDASRNPCFRWLATQRAFYAGGGGTGGAPAAPWALTRRFEMREALADATAHLRRAAQVA